MRYGVFCIYANVTRTITFPFSTFTVNVVGSFLITFISSVAMTPNAISPNTKRCF